ncbi:hypothetical protein DFP73DRAFT_206530 [Morchella snyderi]|nr:hypothetical protein DFP73DRAFT_206530 [Morchella snyderi]
MMGVDILSRLSLLALILLSTFSAYVFALPAYRDSPEFKDGNVTRKHLDGLGDVWYHAEPSGRGTVGILVSCTATYIFCVWTSLHPNILQGKGGLRRACYKVVLMMIAILVPEAIMLCAVGELSQAWKLKKAWENEVEELKKKKENNDPKVQKALKRLQEKLPLEAAFVVVMGGFLINKSKLTAWKELKEGKPKQKGSTFLKSSFETLKRKALGKSTSSSSVIGGEEKIKDKGKSLEKLEKNSTPVPDKWWQRAYVHKLVLTNKTAHYMPSHKDCPGHECDDAEIQYPSIDPKLSTAHECDDAGIQYPPIDSTLSRPVPGRSPASFASCRVTWATDRRASSPLPGSDNDGEARSDVAPEAETNDLEPGTYSTILTPAGLIHCLRHGQIDHNSFHKADMEDKGTSSTIAKFLACAQALWLVAQSFGRRLNNPALPLTLLEVHVLLQVACAGFTYLCWWVKPLGVIEPIVVTLHHRADEQGNFPPEFKHCRQILDLYNESYNSRGNGAVPLHFLTIRKSNRVWRSVWFTALLDVITRLTPTESEPVWKPRTEPAEPKPAESNPAAGNEPIIDKVANYMPRMSSLIVAGLLVAGVGALHLVALDTYFSSDLERALWQASCAGLIAWPFALLPVLYFTDYHEDVIRKIWEFPYQKDNVFFYTFKGIHEVCVKRGNWWTGYKKTFVRRLWIMFHYILVVICVILLVAGLLSSFYLTVESYLAMRSPPAGTFQTPRWADWMPHI